MEAEIATREGAALDRFDASLAREIDAERELRQAVVKGVVIAVPVCIAVWLAIVALAVGDKDPSWGIWLAIGAVVGVVAGAFFGGWAGFLAKAHVLDDVLYVGSEHEPVDH